MLRRLALLAARILVVSAFAAPAAAQSVGDFYGPIGATPRSAETPVPPQVGAASQAAAAAALPAGSSAWAPRRRTSEEARSPDQTQVDFLPAKPPRPREPAPAPARAEGEPLSAEELDGL